MARCLHLRRLAWPVQPKGGSSMNNIIYLIGAIVVIIVVLRVLGIL